MLPTLSHLSVSIGPGSRLRHWCSSGYLRISPLHPEFHFPLPYSSSAVSNAIPRLSPGLSHPTYKAAYARFSPVIPINACTLRITGCWHGVSRCFFCRLRQDSRLLTVGFSSLLKVLYNPQAFFTHAALLDQAFAHCQYSPLLPPVGVWAVSQSQCGWSSTQTSYGSSPW